MTIDVEEILAFSMMGALTCLMLSIPAAFITHLVWTIKLLMGGASIAGGQIVLMLVGIFVPPVGILHGYVLWLL